MDIRYLSVFVVYITYYILHIWITSEIYWILLEHLYLSVKMIMQHSLLLIQTHYNKKNVILNWIGRCTGRTKK